MRYTAARVAEGAALSTVAKELVVLSLTLAEAGFDGVVPRVKVQYRPRERHLTPAEAEALLDALPPSRRLWFMVATFAGLRDSELARLQWSDVELGDGWILVRGRKTAGSYRRVPIAEALWPWLDEAWQPAGSVLDAWTNCRRDLAKACKRAPIGRVGYACIGLWRVGIDGLVPVSANDLRRTFASWLKQAGVDSLTVAHLLEHSSTRMVDLVYGRLNAESYRAAIAQLPCTPGVHQLAHRRSRNDAPGEAAGGDTSIKSVPRAGIEPATRGFSVLCSTN